MAERGDKNEARLKSLEKRVKAKGLPASSFHHEPYDSTMTVSPYADVEANQAEGKVDKEKPKFANSMERIQWQVDQLFTKWEANRRGAAGAEADEEVEKEEVEEGEVFDELDLTSDKDAPMLDSIPDPPSDSDGDEPVDMRCPDSTRGLKYVAEPYMPFDESSASAADGSDQHALFSAAQVDERLRRTIEQMAKKQDKQTAMGLLNGLSGSVKERLKARKANFSWRSIVYNQSKDKKPTDAKETASPFNLNNLPALMDKLTLGREYLFSSLGQNRISSLGQKRNNNSKETKPSDLDEALFKGVEAMNLGNGKAEEEKDHVVSTESSLFFHSEDDVDDSFEFDAENTAFEGPVSHKRKRRSVQSNGQLGEQHFVIIDKFDLFDIPDAKRGKLD